MTIKKIVIGNVTYGLKEMLINELDERNVSVLKVKLTKMSQIPVDIIDYIVSNYNYVIDFWEKKQVYIFRNMDLNKLDLSNVCHPILGPGPMIKICYVFGFIKYIKILSKKFSVFYIKTDGNRIIPGNFIKELWESDGIIVDHYDSGWNTNYYEIRKMEIKEIPSAPPSYSELLSTAATGS